MNRNSKTKGEHIGFSNNASAVRRWILSFSQRAEIYRSCTEMAGKGEGCHKKKDFSKSQYKKDESDIQNARHTIVTLQNPFT